MTNQYQGHTLDSTREVSQSLPILEHGLHVNIFCAKSKRRNVFYSLPYVSFFIKRAVLWNLSLFNIILFTVYCTYLQ